MSEQDNKLKLLGKLGLDLSRLHTDVQTMENLIKKANGNTKELSKAWQTVAGDMKRAFKDFPLQDYLRALDKLEKAQKAGLAKTAKNAEKEQNAEKRRDEKHLNTMLAQQMLYNAKIQTLQERSSQKMAQNDASFLQKQARDFEKHQTTMSRLYDKTHGTSGLGKRLGSLTDYVLASGAIYGSYNAIKQMMEVNREFEVGQMNLQRVLKATSSEMEQVKQITIDVAKATGNATKDIQDIENLWIRTGMANLDNLKELSKLTAIGLNTAGFADAEDSVSKLVGAVNQMADGDVSKAASILDSWVKVADQTAVKNTSDLAEVISRAGSQGRQLGLTFHDLNAMTGILAERMAISGDKIGTALKAVFSRIQDPNHYKEIEKWGVKVTEIGEGGKETFRSMIDIMNDLNIKFKELNEQDYGTAMADIQQAMGGTHQRAIVANLIEGWDRYGTIVKQSMESVGFAEEQNAKIMGTFDAQVKILKASFVELSLVIGQNGLLSALSGLVQGTTGAVNWFSNLNPHIKNTILVALELATAFGALNLAQKKFTQIGIVEILQNIITRRTGIIQLAQAEELLNAKVAAGTISDAQRAQILRVLRGEELASTLQGQARTAMLEAQTAVTWTATTATTAFMTALTAGLVIIPIVIGLISSYNQSKEELNQRTLEHIKATQNEVNETEALIKEYEKLTEQTSLTNDEKSRMNELEVKFAEIFPSTVTGINAQTQAFSNQIDVIKQLNAEKKKALLDEAQLYIDANQSEAQQAQKKVAEYQDNIANAKDRLSVRNDRLGLYLEPTQEQLAEYIIDQKNKMQKYQDLLSQIEQKQRTINAINKSLTEGDTSTSSNSKSSGSKTGTKSSGSFDPDEFDNQLAYMQHQYNMGELIKHQYADKLKAKLAQYKAQDSAEDNKIWDLEEQIYNLLQPEKASSNWKKDLPEGLSSIMNKLDHESKMGQLSNSEYAKKLQVALDEYRNQLDQQAIWGIEERIYSLQGSKPDMKEIDFDTLKKSLTSLGNELTILDKKEQQLQMSHAKSSAFFPLYTQEIENHNKTIKELTSLNAEYKSMITGIDDRLTKLDPKTAHYDEIVKQLTDDKKKLTAEIQNNTEAIYDNSIAIAKINAQMQDMVENNLMKVFDIQKELASTALDNRQEQDMQNLKNLMDSEVKAIQNKIDAKQREIDLLDEQISKEEYLQSLADLRNEMDKVKADTRFAYIDEATGLEVYTYDKQRVLDLQKEIDKKEQDYSNEQQRKKLEDEQKALQDQQQQINDYYNEKMNQLEEHQKLEKANFDAYWSQRLSDENIQMLALQMIQQTGYQKALEISDMYFTDVKSQYVSSQADALNAGKGITENLRLGLFTGLDNLIADYKNKVDSLYNTPTPSSSSGTYSGINRAYNQSTNLASGSSDTRTVYGTNIITGKNEGATITVRAGEHGTYVDGGGNIFTYHTGGFVGGKALSPQHEVVAKLLEGEYVTSIPALNRLSLALPQMTYNSVGSRSGDAIASGDQRPIVIQIDKLTPNDFDDFMRTMQPYITAQK